MTAETPNPQHLKAEAEAFAKLLPSLLDRAGQFAVIVGDQLIGTYSTWEDACKAGYGQVGLDTPFLVKKIEHIETVNHFTRTLAFHCPT